MQISVSERDRHLLNFLWRDNPRDPLKCYQLTRLPFGLNCSPFIATRVLKHIAENNSDASLASQTLLCSTYVDDLLSGADTPNELEILFSQLSSLLQRHNFSLHKIHSNNIEFVNRHNLNPHSEVNLNLENSSSKVLGIKWSSKEDTFFFSPPFMDFEPPLTKRKILSVIAR
uniref:Uncharacterized protein LOC114332340 n=1 Tax=Diabrotica virgifera virgifera TaxID=50390 RepID=A0A6P7FNL3_DIAVI